MKKLLNKIQKKADQDLNIILILTLIPLFFFLTFKQTLFSYINQTSVSLWTRLILLAGLQFAIAVFETPFNGSIISVVGKTTIGIMEPILL